MLLPEDFGVAAITQEAIAGGTSIEASAQIFMDILQGKGTEAQNNVVCANAGIAIATAKECSPKEGFEIAMESLKNGKGLKALRTLQELSS
jgi:anthranilate phosphoribosyltransferase